MEVPALERVLAETITTTALRQRTSVRTVDTIGTMDRRVVAIRAGNEVVLKCGAVLHVGDIMTTTLGLNITRRGAEVHLEGRVKDG